VSLSEPSEELLSFGHKQNPSLYVRRLRSELVGSYEE
jgi:hypothetical protein